LPYTESIETALKGAEVYLSPSNLSFLLATRMRKENYRILQYKKVHGKFICGNHMKKLAFNIYKNPQEVYKEWGSLDDWKFPSPFNGLEKEYMGGGEGGRRGEGVTH
jgi:hypothetical protein